LQDAAQETLAYNMLNFINMNKVLNSGLENLRPSGLPYAQKNNSLFRYKFNLLSV